MSWIDKIQNNLVIITGDGQRFEPRWLNATRQKEYNLASFAFPEIEGELVKRKKRLGRKFNLEIHFVGEDHLDVANQFDAAADDERPWTIEHPYYDSILVHPRSLLQDNSQHNVSKFTGVVLETITEDAPQVVQDPQDTIKIFKADADANFEQSLTADVELEDINSIEESSATNFRLGSAVVLAAEDFEEYTNRNNASTAAVNNAINEPGAAMNALISLISMPGELDQPVVIRTGLLKSQFDVFRSKLLSLLTVSSKQVFQIQGGSILSSMAFASANPIEGDYQNGTEVLEVMEFIINVWNFYLGDLDTLQSDNGGSPESFVPDAVALIQLNSLIYLTVSNLFAIALDSRQERSFILEKETNPIILAHRLYGLDIDDDQIDEILGNNDIGLNQLLTIKKGRRIVYYI